MSGWNSDMQKVSLPHNRTYKVVLFDVSGVLVDLAGGPGSLLPNADDPWGVWWRSSAVRRFETGETNARQFTREMISELDLEMEPAQLYAEFASWPLGLHRGTRSLITALQSRGFRVATLSNTNAIHWPYIVESLGLGRLIEHHFPSHMIGVRKPEQKAFECVTKYFGCSPADILFFDDHQVNVEAAQRLGCSSIIVRGASEVNTVLCSLGLVESRGKGQVAFD